MEIAETRQIANSKFRSRELHERPILQQALERLAFGSGGTVQQNKRLVAEFETSGLTKPTFGNTADRENR
jgi:hypothetical protein